MRAVGQAEFREDSRCSDHLLVLRTLIEQQRERHAPLFTYFVDFRKAYESVPRDLSWQKLVWVFKVVLKIKALCGSDPMAVKAPVGLSEPFMSVMGVEQGCPLSPTHFGLYLDDLEQVFRVNYDLLDLTSLPVQRAPIVAVSR